MIILQAVWYASGNAAASSKDSPAGIGNRLRAGTTASSAKVPGHVLAEDPVGGAETLLAGEALLAPAAEEAGLNEDPVARNESRSTVPQRSRRCPRRRRPGSAAAGRAGCRCARRHRGDSAPPPSPRSAPRPVPARAPDGRRSGGPRCRRAARSRRPSSLQVSQRPQLLEILASLSGAAAAAGAAARPARGHLGDLERARGEECRGPGDPRCRARRARRCGRESTAPRPRDAGAPCGRRACRRRPPSVARDSLPGWRRPRERRARDPRARRARRRSREGRRCAAAAACACRGVVARDVAARQIDGRERRSPSRASASKSAIACGRRSSPLAARAKTVRFSTTVAPGQGPAAHQPTERLGIPADAATSQKSRLRRSTCETGALATRPSIGPSLRRYHEVPQGGRSASGAPAGRTRVRARTPCRAAGTPVAIVVQISGGDAGLGRPPARVAALREARRLAALAGAVEIEAVDRDHDDRDRPGRGLRAERRAPRRCGKRAAGSRREARGPRRPRRRDAGCAGAACRRARTRARGSRAARPPRERARRPRSGSPTTASVPTAPAPRLYVPPIQRMKTSSGRGHAGGVAARPGAARTRTARKRRTSASRRRGQQAREEDMREERRDRRRRSGDAGLRRFDRGHRCERRRERADQDGRQERSAPALEDRAGTGAGRRRRRGSRARAAARGPRRGSGVLRPTTRRSRSRAAVPHHAREVGQAPLRARREASRPPAAEARSSPTRRCEDSRAEDGREIGAVGVASRVLAQRLGIALEIEQVVGDLEGESEVARVRRQGLERPLPAPPASAPPRTAATKRAPVFCAWIASRSSRATAAGSAARSAAWPAQQPPRRRRPASSARMRDGDGGRESRSPATTSKARARSEPPPRARRSPRRGPVERRAAAPPRGVVHRGQVVEHEGSGMEVLDGHGHGHRGRARIRARAPPRRASRGDAGACPARAPPR